MEKSTALRTQIKALTAFFMVALTISGVTAIPANTELTLLLQHISPQSTVGRLLAEVQQAVQVTEARYPFLFYGNDWLAFAHLVIAVAFWGVIKDPVKNIWVLQFGITACAMVLPFALVAGALRGLPLWWRLIDCSFGVLGSIPLWICYLKTKRLERLLADEKLNLIF